MKITFSRRISEFATRRLWFCMSAVALLTILTHITYIGNGFTWQDHTLIEGTRALVAPSRLPAAFFSRYGETAWYRPLATVVYVIAALLFGPWPPGFHATSLAFHVAATLAAPLFVMAFIPLTAAEMILVAAIFGVHPASWVPVGSITFLPTIMSALFTFLSIYGYGCYRRLGSRHGLIVFAISVLAALFSDETAAIWLPLLFTAWELMVQPRPQKANRRLLIVITGSLFLLYAVLRTYAVPEIWSAPDRSLSLLSHVLTRGYLLGRAVMQVFLPLRPSLSDVVPLYPWPHPNLFIALVALIVIAGSFRLRRTSAAFPVSMVFLILIIPALNTIPFDRMTTPAYSYAAAVTLGWAAVLLVRRRWLVGIIVAAVWIVIASLATSVGGYRFHDDLTLFTRETANDRYYPEGSYYLGYHYWQIRDYGRAEYYFARAVPLNHTVTAYVDSPSLDINYGGVLLAQGRLGQAEYYMTEAQHTAPPSMKPLIVYNLALVAAKRMDYRRAAGLLGGNAIRWNRPEPLLLLADSLYRIGRKAEALSVLRQAEPYMSADQRMNAEKFIKTQEGL